MASHHLGPIGPVETRDYIRYRLGMVGWNNDPAIEEDAYGEIFTCTGGVPRKINTFCNRLMLFCFLDELHRVDGGTVRAVADDLAREIGQSIVMTRSDVSSGVMHQPAPQEQPDTINFEQRLAGLERTVTSHSRSMRFFSTLQVLVEQGQTELVWRKRP